MVMFLALHPMESILSTHSFARASSHVADFNTRNKLLTQKLLKQGYRCHKLPKTFFKFYSRYYDLISNFQVGLKSLFRQGRSEPELYGDLVYKLKTIVSSNNFQRSSLKSFPIIKRLDITLIYCNRLLAWWSNPSEFAFLFNCTLMGRTSDSMTVPT